MNHFENFKGFAISPGYRYENHSVGSPIETACRILERYRGKEIEIGCDIVSQGMKLVDLLVPPRVISKNYLEG